MTGPTNIRSGKELVNAAIDAFEHERCRTVLIQPQGQWVYLDCRNRSDYDFRRYLVLIARGSGDASRWLARTLVNGDGKLSYHVSPPPQSQSTAWCHLGPAVVKTLRAMLPNEREAPVCSEHSNVLHLLVFEGASGRAIQKYCIVHSAGEAASITFHHLANGHSLVFAGIVLEESYDDLRAFRHPETYYHCASIQDLDALFDSQPEIPSIRAQFGEGKATIGIIY